MNWLPWRRWKRKWLRIGAELAHTESVRITNHAIVLAAISGCTVEEATQAILSCLKHPAVPELATSLDKDDFIHRVLHLVRQRIS